MIPRNPKDGKPGSSGVRPSPSEKDWKLPDPTQRRRESQTVDISKVAQQTRQQDLSRIILFVSLFLVSLAVVAGGVYLSLNPNLYSFNTNAPGITRVAVDWASNARAVNAFAREEADAAVVSSDQLGAFAQRYWEFEESKKSVSGGETAHADMEREQSLLWKELLAGKDIVSVRTSLWSAQKTVSDAEGERYQIVAAKSDKDLPDGGLREVELLFLTKIPEQILSFDQIKEMAKFNREVVLLLAPYYIESSSESSTTRATELKHDANREFVPMNNWVSLVNAKVAVHADLIGLKLLPSAEFPAQVYFKVVAGDPASVAPTAE